MSFMYYNHPKKVGDKVRLIITENNVCPYDWRVAEVSKTQYESMRRDNELQYKTPSGAWDKWQVNKLLEELA